jgi:tetratricopeptide (TPR) repeat protein
LHRGHRINPKYVDAYYNRGIAHQDKKDHDKAIEDYTEAIRLDPKHLIAYINRANVYRYKKDYDKAIKDYTEAIRIKPTYVDGYYNRGNIYTKKKDYDKAIEDYTRAIRLDPKYSFPYIGRGVTYKLKKDYDKAIEDYSQAIRLDPKGPYPYNHLAWLMATCPTADYRNGKKAVELAKKACELSNWKVWSWIITLAAAHAENGDFEEAIKWQKKAMHLSDFPKDKVDDGNKRLKLYKDHKPYREE